MLYFWDSQRIRNALWMELVVKPSGIGFEKNDSSAALCRHEKPNCCRCPFDSCAAGTARAWLVQPAPGKWQDGGDLQECSWNTAAGITCILALSNARMPSN